MKHPLAAVAAVVLVTSTLWLVTLAQLAQPTYRSIPDRSTQTQFPGP